MDKIFFNHTEINEFISSSDYSGAARLLLKEQIKIWPQLEEAHRSLKDIQIKSFQYEGFVIKVQHNPGRVKSSTAKVDEKSIKERKCFLCPENLYKEQQAIKYKDFFILINPFPILPEHFTIPHKKHIPQSIKEWFGNMLALSKDMQKDVLIYNGPRCGASAPDHLHFQAGTKYFMPLDDEFYSLKNEYGKIIIENDALIVTGIDDGLRRFITIETNDKSSARRIFDIFYTFYSMVSGEDIEPMMNILSVYEPENSEQSYGWRVLIFLRKKHRPSHYFRKGEDKMLISPAAIDFGGVCILPFEKDFDKIKKEDITDIFHEVSLGKEHFEYLKADLKKNIKNW